MLRLYVKFSLLVLLSTGVAVPAEAQVSPVLLVDNSENQALCSTDPSLLAYPCFSTIQAAVNAASDFDSSFILILPTDKPYEGFEVLFGKLRSLLIQGFRGTPLIQGRVSIEGSDWIIMLKNLQLQGDGPLITMGLTGSPVFARLEGIIASAKGTAISVREAVVLEIAGSIFEGEGESGCGLELGGGIIYVSDTAISRFEKGICDRSSAPAKARSITLTQATISNNKGQGVELRARGADKFGIFISQSMILGNGQDGLYLWDVDYGGIAGNTIVGSAQSYQGSSHALAIRAREGPVSIENNTIGNFAYGIQVELGPGLVDISNNIISEFRLCGVTNYGEVTGSGNIIVDGPQALCPSPDRFPPGFIKR